MLKVKQVAPIYLVSESEKVDRIQELLAQMKLCINDYIENPDLYQLSNIVNEFIQEDNVYFDAFVELINLLRSKEYWEGYQSYQENGFVNSKNPYQNTLVSRRYNDWNDGWDLAMNKSVDQSYKDGRECAINATNKDAINPHDYSTPEWSSWRMGYMDGGGIVDKAPEGWVSH